MVFTKMRNKTDDVIRGIVGIISETTQKCLASYNGIGSGVISDKKDKYQFDDSYKDI